MPDTRDRLDTPSQWTFKRQDVAENFDAHVREQLPWYEMATALVAHVGRHYLPRGGLMYDVGCATGNVGQSLEPEIDGRGVRYVPIDESAEMQELFAGPQRGNFVLADARDYEYKPFDFAVVFLTLMFFPPADQHAFIERLRRLVRPGGAILVFDKCLAPVGYPATVLWRLTLQAKLDAGADPGQITRKELSLAGVQRPIDPAILEPYVEVFRFGDFAGWLIERDGA